MISKEKEQLIRKLLKEDKDWEYIQSEAQCSPNTIQKVIEKYKHRSAKTKSARSKAFLMYDKGFTPLEVAVKLDISAGEAEEYKSQYLRLKGREEIERFYEDNKDSIPLMKSIVEEMRSRNITLDQLTQAAYSVNSLPRLRNELQRLNYEIELKAKEYRETQEEFRSLKDELLRKRMELHNLEVENQRIEEIIHYDSNELFGTVSNIVHEILGDKNTLLKAALEATERVIKARPDLGTIIMNFRTDSSALNEFNAAIGPEIISAADVSYEEIFEGLVKLVVERMNSPMPRSAHAC